jgi:hypothetical protein
MITTESIDDHAMSTDDYMEPDPNSSGTSQTV